MTSTPVSPMVVEVEGASSMLLEIDHNDASMVLYVQDARQLSRIEPGAHC